MTEQSSGIPFAVRVTPDPALWDRNRPDRIFTGPGVTASGLQQNLINSEVQVWQKL